MKTIITTHDTVKGEEMCGHQRPGELYLAGRE
jgi:hypothetical protein